MATAACGPYLQQHSTLLHILEWVRRTAWQIIEATKKKQTVEVIGGQKAEYTHKKNYNVLTKRLSADCTADIQENSNGCIVKVKCQIESQRPLISIIANTCAAPSITSQTGGCKDDWCSFDYLIFSDTEDAYCYHSNHNNLQQSQPWLTMLLWWINDIKDAVELSRFGRQTFVCYYLCRLCERNGLFFFFLLSGSRICLWRVKKKKRKKKVFLSLSWISDRRTKQTHKMTRGPVAVSNQGSVERQRRHIPASVHHRHALTHLVALRLQESRAELWGGQSRSNMETRCWEKTVCAFAAPRMWNKLSPPFQFSRRLNEPPVWHFH